MDGLKGLAVSLRSRFAALRHRIRWLVIILSWAIPSMHGKRFLRNLGPAPRKYQRFTIREGLPPALHQAGKQLIANVTFPTGPGYLNVITGMV